MSLGTVGCFILPILKLFSKKRIIINLDGLDDKREKFRSFTQKMISVARRLAAKYATICISDNQGIKDYVERVYKRDSVLIEYGGDNAHVVTNDTKLKTVYGLTPKSYCFKVARIEPENNIEIILEAFSRMPNEKLVIVGNWERSDFGRNMRSRYGEFQNIILLDPIYELQEINLLRTNSKLYIHGHSAGGTNPSLVEAMNLGLCIVAYDVVYNRETTENKALFFNNVESLINGVRYLSTTPHRVNTIQQSMREIAKRRYTWEIITNKYEKLFI